MIDELRKAILAEMETWQHATATDSYYSCPASHGSGQEDEYPNYALVQDHEDPNSLRCYCGLTKNKAAIVRILDEGK